MKISSRLFGSRWGKALRGNSSRSTRKPIVLTEEERASGLRSTSHFHVRELLFQGVDRETVLEKVRAKAPGFPRERYEQELAEAQVLVTSNFERARQRRSELIESARKEDVLNAVFALRYFNRRFSEQHTEYGLGPIDIHEALHDLHAVTDIDAALTRVDELINDAWKPVSYELEAAEARMKELRAAHPGFTSRSLNAAMDWGYLLNR